MTKDTFNDLLNQLRQSPGRENVLKTAFALVDWMGLKQPKEGRERLLAPKKQELKKYLIPHALTNQHQFYRLTEENEPVTIRFAVLKKLRKDQLVQLIDKEDKVDFQSAPAIIQNGKTAPPYFLHIITTPAYDRLYLILNLGNQKRILSFRNKLSQTQYNKIIPAWQNIAALSKPETAKLLWGSLDINEVNKEFYDKIKGRFDDLVEIIKSQSGVKDDNQIKQYAVRLIGRYIFCWFLKEKEIIPEKLINSETISAYNANFFQHYLQSLFFNTLNEEVQNRNKPTTFESPLTTLYENIPYLNGGLFDKNKEDDLFGQLDLNAWLLAFVKVLESFDFTVDESSSQYQQVAIDPEMLGRILENLLASQNPETEKLANQRKALGAFYTPREIVDYMVNESLKSHVEQSMLPDLPDETVIENLLQEPEIAYKPSLFAHIEPQQTVISFNPAKKAETKQKRERLQTKIDKLFAPGCSENPFDKDETPIVREILQKITILDPACGSGAFPMGVLLRLMELRELVGGSLNSRYQLKSEILSRNIYGVDILPIAVEIARLRAWLSLILEADYKPADRLHNFGIAALPNLDFKFVCANSLIDSGYDEFLKKVDHNATLERMDGEIQRLERIKENYYDPKGDKHRKEHLQKEFNQIKNYIKTEFASLKRTWKLEGFFNKVDDWDPFDDSKPSSFFSPGWMFGIRDGFDIVIGNPPYVQIQKGIYSLLTYPYSEGKDKGKQNLYKLFTEASYNLLKPRGTACMIVQSSLLCDLSSTYTRELLLNNSELIKIVEFPKNTKNKDAQVFDSVLQGTCTYIFSKQIPTKGHLMKISIGNDTSTIENLSFEEVDQKSLLRLYPDTFYIPLLSNRDSLVLEKISKYSIAFKSYIKTISQGDLNLTICSNQFSSSETGTKLYRGKNIHKYKLLKKVDEYIIEGFKEDRVEENTRNTFIVLQEITGTTDKFRLHACLTDKTEKFLFGHTANKILLKDEDLNRVCLALLNSKLFDWFFRKTSTNNHVMGYEIFQLPILKTLKSKKEPISTLANKIISAKIKNQDTAILEKEIDIMVYHLYDLTYNEAKIVDADLSLEDFNRYKV